jgi:hypothetical protein
VRPSASCRITTRLSSHASRRDVSAETRGPSSRMDWPGCSRSANAVASTWTTTTWYRFPGAPGSSPWSRAADPHISAQPTRTFAFSRRTDLSSAVPRATTPVPRYLAPRLREPLGDAPPF